jgi:hypothetical protein
MTKTTKDKPQRRNLISLAEAMARLNCKHTKFYDDYVNTGRLKLVKLGPQKKAAVEDEVDALIEEMIAAREEKVG